MKKLLVGLLAVGALSMAAPAVAQASPTHLGSFVTSFQIAHQPHRVYFKVSSSNHGDKECTVLLNRRTTSVGLGTDNVSPLTNVFYLTKAGATRAFNQAQAAPSPTRRIVCSH